jgi:hypothetical protein
MKKVLLPLVLLLTLASSSQACCPEEATFTSAA